MSRLLSVTATIPQVENRTKTVTRRLARHTYLEPGQTVTLVDNHPRSGKEWRSLVDVTIVSVKREPLLLVTDEEVKREGFDMTAADFVAWYCERFKCQRNAEVTRIEWTYPE